MTWKQLFDRSNVDGEVLLCPKNVYINTTKSKRGNKRNRVLENYFLLTEFIYKNQQRYQVYYHLHPVMSLKSLNCCIFYHVHLPTIIDLVGDIHQLNSTRSNNYASFYSPFSNIWIFVSEVWNRKTLDTLNIVFAT